MIPIFLCDDDQKLASHLRDIIQDQIDIFAFDMGPVYVSANPQIFLKELKLRNERAVYFLDIDFPGFENGLELAAKIRKCDPRGFIIFITAHGDLAMDTFRYRLEAMDYIVKGSENLLKSRIQSCLKSIDQRLRDESGEASGYYTLKVLDEVRYLPITQILYFEAIGKNHQICVHMENEMIDFYGSLQQLEQELGERFWRCHRSYLINTSHISRILIKSNEILLDNHEKCMMSRRSRQTIPKELNFNL